MNRLPGVLIRMEHEAGITLLEVVCQGCAFTSALFGPVAEETPWREGTALTLAFKESEVALGKGLTGLLSLRNRHPATVREVRSSRLLTRVVLDFHGLRVDSVITTASVRRLALVPGDAVEWLVKANEMGVEGAGA